MNKERKFTSFVHVALSVSLHENVVFVDTDSRDSHPPKRSESSILFSVHTLFEQRMRFEISPGTRLSRSNFPLASIVNFFFCICVRNDDNKASIRSEELEHMYANYVKSGIWVWFRFSPPSGPKCAAETRSRRGSSNKNFSYDASWFRIVALLNELKYANSKHFFPSYDTQRAVREKEAVSVAATWNLSAEKEKKVASATICAQSFCIVKLNVWNLLPGTQKRSMNVRVWAEISSHRPAAAFPKIRHPSRVCVTGEISRIIQWNIRQQENFD